MKHKIIIVINLLLLGIFFGGFVLLTKNIFILNPPEIKIGVLGIIISGITLLITNRKEVSV